MAYRRSQIESCWRAWVRRHQEYLLTECGIPATVTSDWENWLHLLDQAYCRSTGFDLENLSPEQLGRFFSLLEETNEPGFANMTHELERIRQEKR